jgi:hypothetical protein
VARAALSADEIIELGQRTLPAGVPPTALDEIRGVVDAWLTRFSRETSRVIATQSRLAAGESEIAVWARELAAVGALTATVTGSLPVSAVLGQLAAIDDREQWEATRRLAFRLLNESQTFAQKYGNWFTDEQFKLGNMLDKQLLAAINAAEQWARAIRPELMRAVEAFEAAVVQVFVDVAAALGEILRKIGITVITLPGVAFDLVQWIKDHIGTVLAVGGVAAAGVLGLVLYTTLAPARAVARRAA